MKFVSLIRLAACAAVFAGLSGCATGSADRHAAHHPDAGPAHTDRQAMPDASMCPMHEGAIPADAGECHAMMAEHMKHMSPEMMKQHMEMMGMQGGGMMHGQMPAAGR